jgi:hypothetical protein
MSTPVNDCDLKEQLDRARDRSLAIEPAAQPDRLHLEEPREVPIIHHLAGAATATVSNDELEPCRRHYSKLPSVATAAW